MSEFTNTVDIVGDDAFTDSIIDRSIEECRDNVVSLIGAYAFRGCVALETANFPAATSIGGNAFRGCVALATADFSAVTSIGEYAFNRCSSLTTLILRNTAKVATLSSTNPFGNTPIASGTGYIYVPRSLVDSYKTAANGSTYANQFRALEDYTLDGTVTGELDPSKI